MSEPHSGRPPRGGDRHNAPAAERRTLFQKLVDLLAPGPDSRDELIESLADAEHKERTRGAAQQLLRP